MLSTRFRPIHVVQIRGAKSAESSTFNPDVGRYLGVLDELYNPRKCRDGEKGGRRGAPR